MKNDNAKPRMKCLRPPAETILEVLIAVSAILFVVAPASALYISSRYNTEENRAELVALSLAEEGVELVRNLIATNRLRFPNNPECWIALPTETNTSRCAFDSSKSPSIFSSDYQNSTLKTGLNFVISLDPEPDNPLDPVLKTKVVKLVSDMSPTVPQLAYNLKFEAATGLYNHFHGAVTPYYRQIKITFYNTANNPSYPNDVATVPESIRVYSRVFYKVGTKRKIATVAEKITQNSL